MLRAEQLAARKVTTVVLNDIADSFRRFADADVDGKLSLDLDEFYNMMPAKLRAQFSTEDISTWFNSNTTDLDGNGILSIHEYFLWTLNNCLKRHGRVALQTLFRRYDRGMDGELNAFEFQRLCEDCSIGLVGHVIFRALDADCGGSISYKEIMAAIEQQISAAEALPEAMRRKLSELQITWDMEIRGEFEQLDTRSWKLKADSVSNMRRQLQQYLVSTELPVVSLIKIFDADCGREMHLDLIEFYKALKSTFRYVGLLDTVERVFDSLDQDNQGTIGFDEFFEFLRGRRHSLDLRHKQVNEVNLMPPPGARYKLDQLVWDGETIRTQLVRSMERNYVGPVDIIRRWDQNGDRDIDEAEFVDRIHLMIGRQNEALWKQEIERVARQTFKKVSRKPRDSKVAMPKLDVTELEVWLRGCPADAAVAFKPPEKKKEKPSEVTKETVEKMPWFGSRDIQRECVYSRGRLQRPLTAAAEMSGFEALTPQEAVLQRLQARLGDPRLMHRLLDTSYGSPALRCSTATATATALATERGRTADILYTHGDFWHHRRAVRLRNPTPMPTLLPSHKGGRPTTASLPRSFQPEQPMYGYSSSAWPSARASSARSHYAGQASSPRRPPRDFRF